MADSILIDCAHIGGPSTFDTVTIARHLRAPRLPTFIGHPAMGKRVFIDVGDTIGATSVEVLKNDVPISHPTDRRHLDLSMMAFAMMDVIKIRVTDDNGTRTGPGIRMFHDHGSADHNAMELAIHQLTPHNQMTHVMIADGDFTDATKWSGGVAPGDGARILVPIGVTCTLDHAVSPRYDSLRVDGTLDISIANDVELICEHWVGAPWSTITRGELNTDAERPATRFDFITTFNTYAQHLTNPGVADDMDIERDPGLVGRGFVTAGVVKIYGGRRSQVMQFAVGPLATESVLELKGTGHVGLEAGKQVYIPGTRPDKTGTGTGGGDWVSQSETRVIASVNEALGNTFVTLSAPLQYNHDHQRSDVTDPAAEGFLAHICILDHNILFTSESGATTEPYHRGHVMIMHETSKHSEVMDVTSQFMGRTVMDVPGGFVRDGRFYYVVDGVGSAQSIANEPATARSNLDGRYAGHLHRCGHDRDSMITIHRWTCLDSVGWGFVHHDCAAFLYQVISIRFGGAGIVAEQASELGPWVACFASEFVPRAGFSTTFIKGREDNGTGSFGDVFRSGYGFAMRGRAVRLEGCVSADNNGAFGFYHRGNQITANNVSQLLALPTEGFDLPDIAYLRPRWFSFERHEGVPPQDPPIIHLHNCYGYGCSMGLMITKGDMRMNNDVWTKLDTNTFFGVPAGIAIEYIKSYVVKDFKIALLEDDSTTGGGPWAQANRCVRFTLVGNITITNPRTWGGTGIRLEGSNLVGTHSNDDWDKDNPRFTVVNHSHNEAGENIDFYTPQNSIDNGVVNRAEDVAVVIANMPLEVPVTTTLPFITGSSDLTFFTNDIQVSDGYKKSDSLTAIAGSLADVPTGLAQIPASQDNDGLTSDPERINYILDNDGYWTYTDPDDGNTLKNIILFPLYFSDRIHNTTHKFMHAIEITGSVSGKTNNGVFTRSANQPTRAPIAVSTAFQTPVTIDITGAATDADGDTVTLERSMVGPDSGEFRVNTTTGEIAVTPDPGFVGDTSFDAIIYDGRGRFNLVPVVLTVHPPS